MTAQLAVPIVTALIGVIPGTVALLNTRSNQASISENRAAIVAACHQVNELRADVRSILIRAAGDGTLNPSFLPESLRDVETVDCSQIADR